MRWWFMAKRRARYIEMLNQIAKPWICMSQKLLEKIGGSIERTRLEKVASKCQVVSRLLFGDTTRLRHWTEKLHSDDAIRGGFLFPQLTNTDGEFPPTDTHFRQPNHEPPPCMCHNQPMCFHPMIC